MEQINSEYHLVTVLTYSDGSLLKRDIMNEFAPTSNGIVSRSSIAILSCISLGIGLGSMIHLQNAELCALAGALGLGFYLFLDQHTKAANRRQVQNVRETSERRLTELSSCTMATIDPSAPRPIANAS